MKSGFKTFPTRILTMSPLTTVEAIADVYNLKLKENEENESMTAEEKKALQELESKVNELEKSKERVYHYYSELPNYARDTITSLHKKGVFVGNGAGDINLPESLMRMLVILVNAGVIKV